MRQIYILLFILLCHGLAHAQVTTVNGPTGSAAFGSEIAILANGNYVLVDSNWGNGVATAVGAVYLYNGVTGALISTLTGSSANDQIGSGGIILLSNGNYLIVSTDWDNGSATDAGAVTWGNGTTGVSGVVSASNSLVGSTANDYLGSPAVAPLSNGNYLVISQYWHNGGIENAGAVTWGDGATGITGAVSAVNSLVGSATNDLVGSGGVTRLTNGNYLTISPNWRNGTSENAGAVTWGNGTTGITGVVSAANSLVGSASNDQVGSSGVTELSNSNYAAISPYWNNESAEDAGAVTWGNGSTGITGALSASNSLVGSAANDQVGDGGVTALSNGNYVVISANWDNGPTTNAGAVTWGDGTTGVSGVVSTSNSLVGSTAEDQVGSSAVTALSNGNYVVISANWDNGLSANAGAVTFGNGTTGVSGVVSVSNSLVGSTAEDQVGNAGVTELSMGNYVVKSTAWDNATVVDAGAVTWGNGITGVNGAVSPSNSLVGSSSNDQVGSEGVTPLSNGNYVVASTYWDNTSAEDAGAVTWGDGTTGVSGAVSASNSLVGSTVSDQVGNGGIIVLNNNYVVISPDWDNATTVDVGAVTWANGSTGVKGVVSASNSLVGSSGSDRVGSDGITVLSNGNYVVSNSVWDNGSTENAGAVTWGNGTNGITGEVSTSNSLVGSKANDNVGSGITALSNGNYVVRSINWGNGSMARAGAVTWGNGTTGTTGEVGVSNSLVGLAANDQVGTTVIALTNGNYVVRSPNWDNGTTINAGAVTFGDGTIGRSGEVSASNSLVGSKANDQVGDNVTALSNGNYFVKSNNWDNGSVINPGATTYGNGKVGVSGTINSCNSIIGTTASSSQTVVFNSILDYLFVGYQRGKYFVIHNGTVLAADDTEATQTVANDPVTFLSDCSGICKLAPAGVGTAVSGTVTAKVRVESSAPVINQPYVRRYYDVSPETNTSTATGKLTLFYTQADFDDFNTNRGTAPALPGNPLDLTGIGNLRITQKHGTSTTGTPESYTGWTGSGPETVLINPNDQDIFWNSVEKRWEVTFSVTGFSGFFAHSNIDETALPVSLISFTAQRAEKNALLQWTTAAETNASHFEIERSMDGKSYTGIGTMQALGSMANGYRYSFTDTDFSDLASIAYYRLRSVDMDGSYALSRTERVLPENSSDLTYVYPNPVQAGTYVPVKFSGNVQQIQVLDLQGRQLRVQVNRNNGPFVLDPLPQGMYLIRFDAGKGSETRKLVVE